MPNQDTQTVYRAFPQNFDHPKFYKQITQEEFTAIPKRQMQKAPGLCPGHIETIIHFVDSQENRRYIAEVVLTKGSYYVETPCSWTPTFGMDALDGNLAQDAEEWILTQNLGYKSKRLRALFGDKDKVYFNDYLKLVKLPHMEEGAETNEATEKVEKKKWWKFW